MSKLKQPKSKRAASSSKRHLKNQPRFVCLLCTAIVLLAIMGVLVFFSWTQTVQAPDYNNEILKLNTYIRTFELEVARTPESQQKGLSGREDLSKNGGMLFVFDQTDTHCFWMKGMRFPLDILWLDADKRIVHLKTDVSPSTYPESFCPDTQTQYVLEFNAGTTQELGLALGQQLSFE